MKEIQKRIEYLLEHVKESQDYTDQKFLWLYLRYYNKLNVEWDEFRQLPNFETIRRTRCLMRSKNKFSYSNQTQQFKNTQEKQMRDYVTNYN